MEISRSGISGMGLGLEGIAEGIDANVQGMSKLWVGGIIKLLTKHS
jgi:hypothetical protein